MNILHVSTHDIQGGAARGAYRLHRALLKTGLTSQMIVQSKTGDASDVLGPVTKGEKIAEIFRPILDSLQLFRYPVRAGIEFSPARLPFSTIVRKVNSSPADLVHLHWICGGMLRIEDLATINKPIVWSLHDMWPFTGGCHFTGDCDRYKDQCGACPVLGSAKERDLSRGIFLAKKKTVKKIGANIFPVGVGQWVSDCARNSSVLGDRTIYTIPNPIDTDCFAPVDRLLARELLKLPKDKKLVLFGAVRADSQPRKGFSQLVDALNVLPGKDKLELLVFGCSRPREVPNCGFNIHFFGHLYDDISLRLLYSAADVMVVPSRQESFGQTATEAMACGIPVVAFGATGLLDIVDHKINGYLAHPFDSLSLASGIDWVLQSTEYSALAENAREKVLRCFDDGIVAMLYAELYKKILG